MSDLWLISVPGESYTGFNNIPIDLATRNQFITITRLKYSTYEQ